jgi:hypothetical protein
VLIAANVKSDIFGSHGQGAVSDHTEILTFEWTVYPVSRRSRACHQWQVIGLTGRFDYLV